MQQALRPYATAGVAIVGASLIAVTPGVTPSTQTALARDFALTADFSLSDLTDPYVAAYNTAQDNIARMMASYDAAPNIGFTQAMNNLTGYIQSMTDDPSTIPAMMNAIQTDLKNAWSAITLMSASQDTINDVIRHTMDSSYLAGNLSGGHEIIFNQVPGFLPEDQAATLTPIINFLGSPMSALMLASVSPWIAPWVALGNSWDDISEALRDGDTSTALQGLINIPANMFDASLNGATLNLDSLLPSINDAGLLPGNMEMTHLDFAFGGWFSTGGHVTADPMRILDADGNEIGQAPASGGSIFNSVGFDISGIPVVGNIHAPSDAIGPLGAWLGLSQVIGSQLGWGSWSGKDPIFSIPAPEGYVVDDGGIDDGGAGSAMADSFSFGDLFADLGLAG
ncbi:outer membrane porin GjpA [Mycolicibacter heraklionensis]|uniref:Outer membrane porin GjpA n=1 Tax=Mycolicibacter heraklionensis TaxID=512402 RepID=A0A9X7WEX3_9MYCO|nr:outer membrane porin GjpA [Mycolicibacter heraklionensis]QZA06923.1 outer membrane porin GjpA [Mycolicibacter heraklionensis]